MERSEQQAMPEVPGQRLPIVVSSRASTLRLMLIFTLTGANAGIAIASNLYRSWPVHRALVWTSTAEIIMFALQITLLVIEGLRLRRIGRELQDERQRILADAKTQLDEMFPDQPVKVAGIMLHLQEKIFKP
jgi:hypothetical protein